MLTRLAFFVSFAALITAQSQSCNPCSSSATNSVSSCNPCSSAASNAASSCNPCSNAAQQPGESSNQPGYLPDFQGDQYTDPKRIQETQALNAPFFQSIGGKPSYPGGSPSPYSQNAAPSANQQFYSPGGGMNSGSNCGCQQTMGTSSQSSGGCVCQPSGQQMNTASMNSASGNNCGCQQTMGMSSQSSGCGCPTLGMTSQSSTGCGCQSTMGKRESGFGNVFSPRFAAFLNRK